MAGGEAVSESVGGKLTRPWPSTQGLPSGPQPTTVELGAPELIRADLTDPPAALRALEALRGQAFDDAGPLRAPDLQAPLEQQPAPTFDPADSGISENLERGFEILGELGRGGFGVVYRARDRVLGREVAIKCSLRGARELSSGERRRILSEARALASVDHPNVVRVFSAGESDEGQIQIVMELLRGKSLYEWVKLNGPASADEAAHIGLKLCGALAALHARKLVHRDVKPANVMRVEGGRIVLLDLGFASEFELGPRSAPNEIVGTPLLMAPEQFSRGVALDARTDLYALGVTLYWLVSARYPIEGRTHVEIAIAVREGRSVPLRDRRPSIPPEFAALIDRATALSPRDRFASAGEFERALQRWLGAKSPDARADPLAAATGGTPGSSERTRACTSCGAARVGDESYCKSCGSMLVYPCPRCTSALDLDARYCSRCGLDVTEWRAAEEHLRAAHAAMRRGEFDAARGSLAAAREIQPAHAEFARLSAAIEERAKSYALAASAARKAEGERRFEAARQAWSAALQHAPESPDAKSARERVAELARSASIASAVAGVQRACEAANWSAACAALAHLERLAGERDATLATRAREQVGALELRVAATRATADTAYERRDTRAHETACATLRELGEVGELLALRDAELAKLRARDEALQQLERGDVPHALRLLRELRKRASDWPRVEMADLEKRVLAARTALLAAARDELAQVLERSGLESGEAWLDELSTLRPDEELQASLQAILSRARSQRRAWVVIRNSIAATALCGLAVATVWTLRLLRESGERDALAAESDFTSAPAPRVDTGELSAANGSDSVMHSPPTDETSGSTKGDDTEAGGGATLPPAPPPVPPPGDLSVRSVVHTCAWPAIAIVASRRCLAVVAQTRLGVELVLAAIVEVVRAPEPAPPRPPVGTPQWLAEYKMVLTMGGPHAGRGEGPTLALRLWNELETGVRAGFSGWTAPGEAVSHLRDQLDWQHRLLDAYPEYLGVHDRVLTLREVVCEELANWAPRDGLASIEGGENAAERAVRWLEAAPLAPQIEAWLRAVLELEPELFKRFEVEPLGWRVVAVSENEPRRIPSRLRQRTTRESFVAVPRGERSYYICESKLGYESLRYEASKSVELKPPVEPRGVLPHAARSWALRHGVGLPTAEEWELARKLAPLYSALGSTMDIGPDELCEGGEAGELEFYVCGPNSFSEPADISSSEYAWRPVQRGVLRCDGAPAR